MAEVDKEEKVKILEAKIAELEGTDTDTDEGDDVQIIIEDDGEDDEAAENGEAHAVNSQKSRRSREFEELRKRAAAANKSSEEEGGELSAFERMQLKKRQELDELRARGGFNAANKSRFDTGQALTTGMLGFERSQKLAAEEERKKRLEASEGLKKTNVSGMSSWERNQLLGKDEARRRQLEAREGLHRYRLSLDPGKNHEESPVRQADAAAQHYDSELQNSNETGENSPEKKSGISVAAAAAQLNESEKISNENNVGKVDKVIPEPKQEKPIKKEQEETPMPKAKEDAAAPETTVKTSSPKAKEDDVAPAEIQRCIQNPPTYSRVDIKFSFGLVVKSGTTDENLRDSETLRKCMSGTKDILTEQLPPPPKPSDVAVGSTVSFPQAYYDPILEPNVLGIQEDKSKKPAKGKNNTRTLCKASFPIFIRVEATDDEGKKRAALSLKETKATIFKALRAAVSGGNFLK